MLTEQDLERCNIIQAQEINQKEKERLQLNQYCADNSIPTECKAEAIIDYQLKWGKL
jgi:hypothetical protein